MFNCLQQLTNNYKILFFKNPGLIAILNLSIGDARLFKAIQDLLDECQRQNVNFNIVAFSIFFFTIIFDNLNKTKHSI